MQVFYRQTSDLVKRVVNQDELVDISELEVTLCAKNTRRKLETSSLDSSPRYSLDYLLSLLLSLFLRVLLNLKKFFLILLDDCLTI